MKKRKKTINSINYIIFHRNPREKGFGVDERTLYYNNMHYNPLTHPRSPKGAVFLVNLGTTRHWCQ